MIEQERLRDSGLEEDKELALAIFSGRCPAIYTSLKSEESLGQRQKYVCHKW